MADRVGTMIEAVKRLSEKEAFLFDMDGLIFDSEQTFMEQLALVMKEAGYSLTREIYLETLGLGGAPLVEKMCSYFGTDYPFEEMSRKTSERVRVISETVGFQVKKGIRETLSYLKEKGKKTAVASTTNSGLVKKYLADAELLSFFDVIVGGEEIEHSKPEPDIFIRAMELLKTTPENSVVLEDSENGVLAGFKAGCEVICVPDLKYPKEEVCKLVRMLVC